MARASLSILPKNSKVTPKKPDTKSTKDCSTIYVGATRELKKAWLKIQLRNFGFNWKTWKTLQDFQMLRLNKRSWNINPFPIRILARTLFLKGLLVLFPSKSSFTWDFVISLFFQISLTGLQYYSSYSQILQDLPSLRKRC
ncbi:hypothetical protein M9H77_02526 [Catharanthus roseus]|uniref:Uncharacterized protein n=1 Tax=Catharanthus roseus TaxID=4058 RepID=A0ACC0C928_CATRO|nr:hypothetical protein M9H77_02526 [Catharanthus roseus]